jgi:hypothetical protein
MFTPQVNPVQFGHELHSCFCDNTTATDSRKMSSHSAHC